MYIFLKNLLPSSLRPVYTFTHLFKNQTRKLNYFIDLTIDDLVHLYVSAVTVDRAQELDSLRPGTVDRCREYTAQRFPSFWFIILVYSTHDLFFFAGFLVLSHISYLTVWHKHGYKKEIPSGKDGGGEAWPSCSVQPVGLCGVWHRKLGPGESLPTTAAQVNRAHKAQSARITIWECWDWTRKWERIWRSSDLWQPWSGGVSPRLQDSSAFADRC